MALFPAISVVIPTWNRAHSIRAAITSALEQTSPPVEILVCDDGSTDNTEAVVRAIGDSRIRWLPASHAGRPAVPRNRGVAVAKGEWVAFLDSDDIWSPRKLERQFAAMEASGLRAGCCDATRILPEIGEAGRLLDGETTTLDFSSLIRVNRVICSSALVHRSLLPWPCFPEHLSLDEDYACWLRVSLSSRFLYLAEPLVLYSDNPAYSIRGVAPDGWRQRLAVLEDFRNWCRNEKVSVSVTMKVQREILRAKIGRSVRLFLS